MIDLNKPLDGLGLSQVNAIINNRLAKKQNTFTGLPGQVVGFSADGSAVPVQGWSNPNLFINSYWANKENIINQKGQEEYTGNGYTIDGWIEINSADLTIGDDGIIVHADSTRGDFMWGQLIDDFSTYKGKTLTLSFLVMNASVNYKIVLWYSGSGGQGRFEKICSSAGLQSLTFTLPEIADKMYALISRASAVDTTVKMKAAKLELGAQQTLAHQDEDGNWVLNDPPPDRALELAKCQRYYWKSQPPTETKETSCFVPLSGSIGGIVILTALVNVPVTMRVRPALKINGKGPGESISMRSSNTNKYLTGILADLGGFGVSEDGLIKISLTNTSGTLEMTSVYEGTIELDARL